MYLKKHGYFFLIFLGSIFILSFVFSRLINYQNEKRIYYVAEEFNKLSPEKINETIHNNEIFHPFRNGTTTISSNNKVTTIEISTISMTTKEYPIYKSHINNFIKVFLPKITVQDLNSIHTNLLTEKDHMKDDLKVNETKYKGINFKLFIYQFKKDNLDYLFCINVPNKYLKIK